MCVRASASSQASKCECTHVCSICCACVRPSVHLYVCLSVILFVCPLKSSHIIQQTLVALSCPTWLIV